ncbi:FHA domain-containing protein, partial [bacterium]|nr:FHA domain-containing protein [bacterium]
GSKRHPLLPAASFTLGRDATSEIVVLDRSISRQHARVEREGTGFVIRDLGSTYGTFVGGMRIKKDVVLKDGDEIQLGRVCLEFRDGGLSRFVQTTRRVGPERVRVRMLPPPVIHGLTDAADKRVVLPLLEDLAPDSIDASLAATRKMLTRVLGGDTAEAVSAKLESVLRKARSTIPPFLFAITHENLGDDVEAWLTWWDHAQASYPPQLAPQQPQPLRQLRVTRGEPEPRVVLLGDRTTLTLGRDEKSDLPLQSQSVSRLHATIHRLHRRFVIKDEGSRFGTLVNGQKMRMGFLSSGDRIELGKVEVVFEVLSADPGATNLSGEAYSIDPDAFFALVEQKHPATALGLVRLLEAEADTAWVDEEARKLFDDPKRAGDLAKSVRRAYERRAKQARDLLPALLGESAGASLAGWREKVDKAQDLPAQVLPEGWFASGTGHGSQASGSEPR